jgi:cholesterol transport system auxiliary component
MKTPRVLLVGCLVLAGCALTAKGEPLRPRYFTPDTNAPATPHLRAPASNLRLRLGPVVASSGLREQIPYRDSEHELGYYQERRWTERPEVFLRRALSRSLFEEHGAIRVVSGFAPTLEVELTAFEEIRVPAHKARLQAIAILHDEHIGRLEQTITVERPIAQVVDARKDDALVQALSEALAQGVAEISDRVLARVAALEAAETPAIGSSEQGQVGPR